MLNIVFNHERWVICSSCGFEFDARSWGPQCPKCRVPYNKNGWVVREKK